MTIPLGEYAQVSDKLCVCYLGSKTDIIQRLYDLRPAIEKEYQGVEIHYAFRDDMVDRLDYLSENDRIVPQSKLKAKRRCFAYVLDITRNDLDEFFSDLGVDKSR